MRADGRGGWCRHPGEQIIEVSTRRATGPPQPRLVSAPVPGQRDVSAAGARSAACEGSRQQYEQALLRLSGGRCCVLEAGV